MIADYAATQLRMPRLLERLQAAGAFRHLAGEVPALPTSPPAATSTPRSLELVGRARDLGAIGATISGAGPSVMLWCYWQDTGKVVEAEQRGRRPAGPRCGACRSARWARTSRSSSGARAAIGRRRLETSNARLPGAEAEVAGWLVIHDRRADGK